MLDADGYPKAFFEINGYRLTFSRGARYQGEVKADVLIELINDAGEDK